MRTGLLCFFLFILCFFPALEPFRQLREGYVNVVVYILNNDNDVPLLP